MWRCRTGARSNVRLFLPSLLLTGVRRTHTVRGPMALSSWVRRVLSTCVRRPLLGNGQEGLNKDAWQRVIGRPGYRTHASDGLTPRVSGSDGPSHGLTTLLIWGGGSINRLWPVWADLSWTFDILNILVSWAYSPTHLSCLIANPKWDWVIPSAFAWVILSSGTWDRCGCGFLVTLGGYRHLDGLEQRRSFGKCWWLFVADSGDCERSCTILRWRATR
jgi:hypothetical protein